MEEFKAYLSSSDNVQTPDTLRARRLPDVPEDVDFVMEHLNDPNYDLKKPPSMHSNTYDLNQGKFHSSEIDSESQDDYSIGRAESRNSTAIDFDDESPYPEVRAAVASVDDPSMPVNTFRMWFLGLFFTIAISGLNQFFSMRYPTVYVTGIVAQLLSLPMGKGLEIILPTNRFTTFGYVWSLNPGPFNIKEHVCVTVMANSVIAGAYATDVLLSQKIFYGQTLSWGYQILVTLSTQIIGFSLGGLLRQFVVWPSSMIWPGALVNSALFNTLHRNYGKRDRGHITRERFFLIAMGCSFIWFWFPGYLFTALSVFNWVCWIVPNNVPVNILFGTNTGLGMGVLTFDWSMIAYLGSPLVTPWWSALNIMISFVAVFWVLTPILYFTNTWDSAFLPISSYMTFNNKGLPYDPAAIVTNGLFDKAKYEAYSPLLMPAALAMGYGAGFGAFTSIFVHTFLWFRRDIARRFRSTLKDERDIHSRLMQAYPEVPAWWYGAIGIISMLFMLVGVSVYNTQLPAWAAIIAFILASITVIPAAMLQAITNQTSGFQIMHELIAGYMIPGRPVANMLFKCIAYIGANQAVAFAHSLKLGHYMKIPPRMMFSVQLVSTTVCCFVVLGVQNWALSNIVDICTPHQPQGFVCAPSKTFGTSSLIWGGIGPARIFGEGAPYSGVLWFFGVGALAPIPFYFLARRFPLSFWRYINVPVCFAGINAMPPATGINYISWGMVGFIFNYFIRRFHFRWWMRYNYILSAALDAGVAISLVVVFFAVQYPKGGFNINWWGNTVWMKTADAMGIPLRLLQPNQTIGPQAWS